MWSGGIGITPTAFPTSMMAGLRAGQELAAMPATISAQPTHFIGLTVSPTTTTLVLMPNRGTSSA